MTKSYDVICVCGVCGRNVYVTFNACGNNDSECDKNLKEENDLGELVLCEECAALTDLKE